MLYVGKIISYNKLIGWPNTMYIVGKVFASFYKTGCDITRAMSIYLLFVLALCLEFYATFMCGGHISFTCN